MPEHTQGCVVIVHTGTGVLSAALAQVVKPEPLIITGTTAAEVNARLHGASVPAPLVLVLLDEAVGFAPALALGQRSAGRRIAGYCLVDPVFIASGLEEKSAALKSTGDWPDAPVCIAALADEGSASARLARLHGWEFITAQTPAALAEAISHWGMDRRLDL